MNSFRPYLPLSQSTKKKAEERDIKCKYLSWNFQTFRLVYNILILLRCYFCTLSTFFFAELWIWTRNFILVQNDELNSLPPRAPTQMSFKNMFSCNVISEVTWVLFTRKQTWLKGHKFESRQIQNNGRKLYVKLWQGAKVWS